MRKSPTNENPYGRGSETLKEKLMLRPSWISHAAYRLFAISALLFFLTVSILPTAALANNSTAASNPTLAEVTKQELIQDYMPGVKIPEGQWWKDTKSDKVFPASWDWRNINGEDFTTPVKSQNLCGACGAFGFTGAFEAMFKITMDNSFIQPDFSEYHIFSCAGGTCTNGRVHATMLEILETNGIADEACLPYLPWTTGCSDKCADYQNRSFKVSSSETGEYVSDATIKDAVMNNGPVGLGMLFYVDHYTYSGGVYYHASQTPLSIHAVVAVGWDDAEGVWILKDDWGPNWGENGYMKLAYGDCDIGLVMYKLNTDATTLCGQNAPPTIQQLTLTQSSINPGDQLEFSFNYQDVEANLSGGELWYAFDDEAAVRYDEPLTGLVGTSTADKAEPFSFLVNGPITAGNHDLKVFLKDTCGESSTEAVSAFNVIGGSDDDDDDNDDNDDNDDDNDNDDDDDDNDNDDTSDSGSGDDDDDDGCGC